ncbi:MAG: type II secretion system F family protein, partial [Planctomycetota bacterium]|nr:type II secretion system F family protein [Planctomycetota bacterium]
MTGDWVIAFSVTITATVCGAALLFVRDWLHKRRLRGQPGPACDTLVCWLLLSGLLFAANAAILAPLSRNSFWWPFFLLLNAVVAATAAAFLVVLLTQRPWMLLALMACAVLGLYGYLFWAGVVLAALVLGVAWRPGTAERRRQLSYVLEEIAEALRQGLPLHEIMEALSQDQRGSFAGVLRIAAERLKDGAPLSLALDAPRFVPPHVLAALRAGEVGGGKALPHVLRGAAADLRAEARAR